MSGTHESGFGHLMVLLQDGRSLALDRDDQDQLRLVSAGAGDVPTGSAVVGFGPWPSWPVNVSGRVATLPDEESGLFEPERLFVLREQYLFLSDVQGRAVAFGPIDRACWEGTESVIQARQKTGKH